MATEFHTDEPDFGDVIEHRAEVAELGGLVRDDQPPF